MKKLFTTDEHGLTRTAWGMVLLMIFVILSAGCATHGKTYVTCDQPEFILKPEALQKEGGWICEDCKKASQGYICYCR